MPNWIIGVVTIGFLLSTPTLAQKIKVPYPDAEETLHPSYLYREPGTTRAFQLAIVSAFESDTVPSFMSWKIWYRVSRDSGKTFAVWRACRQSRERIRLILVGRGTPHAAGNVLEWPCHRSYPMPPLVPRCRLPCSRRPSLPVMLTTASEPVRSAAASAGSRFPVGIR